MQCQCQWQSTNVKQQCHEMILNVNDMQTAAIRIISKMFQFVHFTRPVRQCWQCWRSSYSRSLVILLLIGTATTTAPVCVTLLSAMCCVLRCALHLFAPHDADLIVYIALSSARPSIVTCGPLLNKIPALLMSL